MTLDQLITVIALIVMIGMLVREMVAPSLAVSGTLIVLLVLGVVGPADALSGFSNPAPITVAALYVIARAAERTGALLPVLRVALSGAGSARAALVRLVAPVAFSSAFLNNTPIVAMLLGPVTAWADRNNVSASKGLMPLSFAAMLGGLVTVLGTSTNLVVSGLLEAAGQEPLGIFELTRVGLPVALIGVVAIVILAPIVLPARRSPKDLLDEPGREFVVSMQVAGDGPIDMRSVEQAGLRQLKGLFLVEVERHGELIAPVAPTFVLRGDDVLKFVGRADDVLDLQSIRGLKSTEEKHLADFSDPAHTFFEVVIGAASPLLGKTLKEADFRSRYLGAVVAIHRSGARVRNKLGAVPLRVGDTLLVLSDEGFEDRWRNRHDFLLISRFGGAPPALSSKAWMVGLTMLGVVACAATGVLSILQAALLGALATVFLRILSPGEARDAVDLDVVILIASAFGIGAAIEVTGLAQAIGDAITSVPGAGPGVLLALIILATMALTEMITNNAAAALMFPLAISAGNSVGLDPRSVALAVAIAASSAFLTPIGYQTNTMVYGPGGYRFGDYMRLGLPISIVSLVATVLILR